MVLKIYFMRAQVLRGNRRKTLGTKHCEDVLLLPLPILLLLLNEIKYFYGSQYDKVEALETQHWELVAPSPHVNFADAELQALKLTFPNLEHGILILLPRGANDNSEYNVH